MKSKAVKILAIVFAAALALDIFTKYLIKTHMRYGESRPVIDGFFNIVYALNPGAAFGILSNMHESYRQMFFIGITVIAIIVVLILFIKERRTPSAVGYALILAGAVGNLIDRIHTGHVVDFMDFRVASFVWPAFNIADMCITIGIAMLIIDAMFLTKPEDKKQESQG